MYFYNSHTIEVSGKDMTVRINNDADTILLTRAFRMLQGFSCLEKIYIVCGYTGMTKSIEISAPS